MDPLDTIRQRIEAGDRERAKRELSSILCADPQNMLAWELLAPLLEDPAQRADCYRQILRIDPDNREAQARLHALTSKVPQPSPDHQPISQEAEEIGISIKPSPPTRGPGLLGGLLHLLGVNTGGRSQAPRRPALTGFGETPPRQEPLSPDDIIRLAGGALPPEERQNCPKCDAVVSKNAAKCPWCDTSLGS